MDTLAGLFVASLLAATLLPGGSEIALGLMQARQSHPDWQLWLAATAGNSLGGLSSWGIGWLIARGWGPERLERPQTQQAIARIRHWGAPGLLLAWLPIIGDPLCVAAGWLRIGFWASALWITLGKGARYAALLWLLDSVTAA